MEKKEKQTQQVKKKLLLKRQHTHAGVVYPVGTPLDKLKASDTDIAFMKERNVI